MYTWQWDVISNYSHLFIVGTGMTIVYTVTTSVTGLLLGLFLAVARLGRVKLVIVPATVFLEIMRGTPLLVLLIWFFYAFPILTGIHTSPPLSAFLALSLYGSAFYAEIIRGGILSVEQGQIEAARSLGMTYWEQMKRVVLPQAARRMVPPLMNQTIMMLKNTSLASVVTVAELVYQGQFVSSLTYRPLEVYTAIGGIYLAIIYPLTVLSQRLELGRGGAF